MLKGKLRYKMFDATLSSVQYVTPRQIAKYLKVLAKDKNERIKINLNKVKQLNGNNYLKKLYKKRTSHAA